MSATPKKAPKAAESSETEVPKAKKAPEASSGGEAKKVEDHADETKGAVDKVLHPHGGAATLEALKKEKDIPKKKALLEKMELSHDEAEDKKLIHELQEYAGDEHNTHVIDEKIKAAKEKKDEKKVEKKEEHPKEGAHPAEVAHGHGPEAANDDAPKPAEHAAHAHPAEAPHPAEPHDDKDTKPPGFFKSFLGPLWNVARTVGAVAGFGTRLVAGVIPPLRRTKWFHGAAPVEPVAKVKAHKKTAAANLPEAHH